MVVQGHNRGECRIACRRSSGAKSPSARLWGITLHVIRRLAVRNAIGNPLANDLRPPFGDFWTVFVGNGALD